MAMIETEVAARRLARAICADITLYQRAKIEAGADLTEEYLEGRGLFLSRVAEALHPIFDEEVAGAPFGRIVRVGSPGVRDAPAVAPVAPATQRPSSDVSSPVAPSEPNSGSMMSLVVAGALLLVAILGVLMLRR